MAGAPIPIPGSDGGPGNVLVIPQAGVPEYLRGNGWSGPQNDWVDFPTNVLIIPQLTKPDRPLVPQTTNGQAVQYNSKCCARGALDVTGTFDPSLDDGNYKLLAHDSVTGWWFEILNIFGGGCNTENFNTETGGPDGTCGPPNRFGSYISCPVLPVDPGAGLPPGISIEHYAQLIMSEQDAPFNSNGIATLLDPDNDFASQLPPWAAPKNWDGELSFDEWTIACADTAETITVGNSPCSLPPWLSCAPSLVQSAYCYVLNWVEESCNPTNVARCTALLLAGTLDEEIPSCLAELALTCTSAIVITAINSLIGWLQFNPFGCNIGTTPGQCAAPKHLPPCASGECFSADGCCGPCDPPLPYNNAGPLIGGGLGGGLGGVNQDALPLIPTPLTIPLPTTAIAVTACKECDSGDDEVDVDEVPAQLGA